MLVTQDGNEHEDSGGRRGSVDPRAALGEIRRLLHLVADKKARSALDPKS